MIYSRVIYIFVQMNIRYCYTICLRGALSIRYAGIGINKRQKGIGSRRFGTV